jgi:exonuclease VII small subunit
MATTASDQNSTTTPTNSKPQTLEEKLIRFKQIVDSIEQRQVGLQSSYELIEELSNLKESIEKELTEIETKLITLNPSIPTVTNNNF